MQWKLPQTNFQERVFDNPDLIEKMFQRMDVLEQMLSSIIEMKRQDIDLETRLASIDDTVKHIANSVCGHADKDFHDPGDLSIPQEDRKRLKERLKKAMDHHHEARTVELDKIRPDWLEYIFGICGPDGRLGKEGSR